MERGRKEYFQTADSSNGMLGDEIQMSSLPTWFMFTSGLQGCTYRLLTNSSSLFAIGSNNLLWVVVLKVIGILMMLVPVMWGSTDFSRVINPDICEGLGKRYVNEDQHPTRKARTHD